MGATMRGQRGNPRLRVALAGWLLVVLLGASLPPDRSLAQPAEQRRDEVGLCRSQAPPLLLTYDDPRNGFNLKYPDSWVWRVRSDALPGARSDTVWFGPNLVGGEQPNCIITLRLSMHYFLADAALEEMRDSTAMLDLLNILTRALQSEVAREGLPQPTAGPLPALGLPAAKLPQFWGFQSRRQLWGGERLTLPGGRPYYREIGTGPVQDLERRERPGSIVRYVIAVSPRAMLEVVGEATVPEFEGQYGRLFDQMVQTVSIRDEVSPHPGPVGQSVEPGACQAVILVNDLDVRPHERQGGLQIQEPLAQQPFLERRAINQPFLERSAITQRVQIQGAAFPVDVAAVNDPLATDVACAQPITRMAVFLDPPFATTEPRDHDVSVYGLPFPDAVPLRGGIDVREAGYFLSWSIPEDEFGQRNVYIAAQLADGRWSWITRQVNIAPPLSVEIAVNPPQVEIGQQVTVVMRVLNNTRTEITGVYPILYPTGGAGVALLRDGPTPSNSPGCDLRATPAQRQAAEREAINRALGIGAPAQADPSGRRTGDPASVSLAARGDDPRQCALFFWTFTALRSGALSFTGTARGRQTETVLRPLGRLAGLGAARPQQVQPPPPETGVVSAPITTAADVQIRPLELQLDRSIRVVPNPDNPRRIEVWMPVRNTGGAAIYNLRARIDITGTVALPSPISIQGRSVDYAYLRGVPPGDDPAAAVCLPSPALFRGFGVTGRGNVRVQLQLGDTAPFLYTNECVAFVRAFEILSDAPLDERFMVQGRVSGTTQHSSSQALAGGVASTVYPELDVTAGPFSAEAARDLLTLSELSELGLLPESRPVVPGPTTRGGPPGGPGPAPGPGGRPNIAPPSSGSGPTSGSGASATGAGAASTGDARQPALPATDGAIRTSSSTGGALTSMSSTSGLQNALPAVTVDHPAQIAQESDPAGERFPSHTIPGLREDPEEGTLAIRLRAQPLASRESRVFSPGDRVRVTMDVVNKTGLPLTNVRPDDLRVNGQLLTDVYVAPGGTAGGVPGNYSVGGRPVPPGSAPGRDRGEPGGGGAAGGAGAGPPRGAGTAFAPGASQLVSYCVLEPPRRGGVLNQLRVLSGPTPPVISRLAPRQTGTFTWDVLIQSFREDQPQLIFEAGASGDFATEHILGLPIQAEPIELAIGCVSVTIAASPERTTSGGFVDVVMRAHTMAEFGFDGLRLTYVYPTPLTLIVERDSEINAQLVSGPINPISGDPINLGPNEVTYFNWRYQVSGDGCFRFRGQLGGRPLFVTAQTFFSNNVESNTICLPSAPRRRL
jgi:hypothetical protein